MHRFEFLLVFLLFATACKKDESVSQPVDSYWQVDAPENHGLPPDSLSQIIQAAKTLPNFYALLVIRNNRLIVEEYFNGRGANDLLHLRSITKNFTSALADIAIQKGTITNLDETLREDFPAVVTGTKAEITIRHLLNMTSGLQWNEDAEVIPLIEHRIANPVVNLLSRPLANDPGDLFNYNSVLPHVLSEVITSRSGISFEQYARDNILDPLGITNYAWTKDPNEKVWGGFGLQLTPRDLAKLGQLYLQEGKWESNQIIRDSWVALSQTSQITTTSGNSGYSLQWWISKTFSDPLFFGNGYGGQGLMILPERDMVVLGMQEYLVSGEQSNTQWNNFVNKLFIPLFNALEG